PGALLVGAQAADADLVLALARRLPLGAQLLHLDVVGGVGAPEGLPVHAAGLAAHRLGQSLPEAGAEWVLGEGAGALAALLDARLGLRVEGDGVGAQRRGGGVALVLSAAGLRLREANQRGAHGHSSSLWSVLVALGGCACAPVVRFMDRLLSVCACYPGGGGVSPRLHPGWVLA